MFRLGKTIDKVTSGAIKGIEQKSRDMKTLIRGVDIGGIHQSQAQRIGDQLKRDVGIIRRRAIKRLTGSKKGRDGDTLLGAHKRATKKFQRRTGVFGTDIEGFLKSARYGVNTEKAVEPGGPKHLGIVKTLQKRIEDLRKLHTMSRVLPKGSELSDTLSARIKQATNRAKATAKFLEKNYPTQESQ
jgi:hypothetical protein